MEVHNDWYRSIAKQISLQKDTLSRRAYKSNKLDLLLRIAKRVADYSPDCGECQNFRGQITKLAEDLGDLLSSKEKRKGYFNAIEIFTKHLQKYHKLITEGKNTKRWGIIGGIFGVVFLGTLLKAAGMAMGISNGLFIGLIFGGVIGIALDAIAKKRGRVI
jgi:hypothetical protein